MKKPLTVREFISLLETYDQTLPIVLYHNPMGWVNGISLQEDTVFSIETDKSNKFYMLFEEDRKERSEISVLKIEGFYSRAALSEGEKK